MKNIMGVLSNIDENYWINIDKNGIVVFCKKKVKKEGILILMANI